MKPEIENIIAELFPEYLSITDEEEQDDFWNDLSEKDKYRVNKEYLLKTGDPKHDYLVCWEPGRLDENESLFDYPTFYELDKSWWEFQKKANWESIEDSKKWMENDSEFHTPEKVADAINRWTERYKEYEIESSGDWFRLMEGDTFIYCQITSLKWYMFFELETLIDDLLESNIPWKFRGHSGDWLKSINESDPEKCYDAGGREVELDRMKTLVREYSSNKLLDKIKETMAKYPYSGKTFRFDRGYTETETEKFDPFTDFIFFDEESLKNVRTTNFLEDFKIHQLNNSLVTTMIEDLKTVIQHDFNEMYNENKSRYI